MMSWQATISQHFSYRPKPFNLVLSVLSKVTRLGDFSPIGLLFVGSLKKQPKMAIPWTTNLLHFHQNKLFKKWFLIWHYFVWQLIIGYFSKNWAIFSISSGHSDPQLHYNCKLPCFTRYQLLFYTKINDLTQSRCLGASSSQR